jgi:hypothetical protein
MLDKWVPGIKGLEAVIITAQDNQNGKSVLQTSQFVEEIRTAQQSPSQHLCFTRY